jgi:hypothetical protein
MHGHLNVKLLELPCLYALKQLLEMRVYINDVTDQQFISTRLELCRDAGCTYVRFFSYYK